MSLVSICISSNFLCFLYSDALLHKPLNPELAKTLNPLIPKSYHLLLLVPNGATLSTKECHFITALHVTLDFIESSSAASLIFSSVRFLICSSLAASSDLTLCSSFLSSSIAFSLAVSSPFSLSTKLSFSFSSPSKLLIFCSKLIDFTLNSFSSLVFSSSDFVRADTRSLSLSSSPLILSSSSLSLSISASLSLTALLRLSISCCNLLNSPSLIFNAFSSS